MTRLLDIFNEAMSHPRDSAEREAGLAQLGEAIRRQAYGVIRTELFSDDEPHPWIKESTDWAKRAANDTDED